MGARLEEVATGLVEPFAVEFDGGGNMYVPEMTGHRVRRIGVDGTMTTVAGTGEAGFSGDGGKGEEAQVNGVHEVRMRPATEQLYVADTWNHRVRMVDLRTGVISTVL